jgi:pyruvate dehydrogenase E1 component beta subunit
VYVIGEAVGSTAFSVVGANSGLAQEFGESRVRETAIIECLIGGSSVGAALAGMRPVADFMLADFMFPAMDEVLAKAGLWLYEHGANGDMKIPLVFRAGIGGYGAGAGAEHSRAPIGYFMHAQGLKLAIPTTPYDAKGLLKTAIRDDNPVVFLEPKSCYRKKGYVPEEEYTVPFGVASVRKEGTDVTVVADGNPVIFAIEAAEQLEKEGISVEVVDPRTLVPLDIDTIVASVRKTGRVVIVDEDAVRCGVGAEIGMQIVEQAFDALKAPIQRVGNPNIPVPASVPLVKVVLPQTEDIIAAIRATLDG